VSEGAEEPLVDYLVAHPEMVTAILDRHVATPSGACAGCGVYRSTKYADCVVARSAAKASALISQRWSCQ